LGGVATPRAIRGNPNARIHIELELFNQVAERLGHSSITETANTYGHLFPSKDDGAELAAAEQAVLSLHAAEGAPTPKSL
jgi:integrase